MSDDFKVTRQVRRMVVEDVTCLVTDDWLVAESAALSDPELRVAGTHPSHDFTSSSGVCGNEGCKSLDNGSYGSHAPCGFDFQGKSLFQTVQEWARSPRRRECSMSDFDKIERHHHGDCVLDCPVCAVEELDRLASMQKRENVMTQPEAYFLGPDALDRVCLWRLDDADDPVLVTRRDDWADPKAWEMLEMGVRIALATAE